MKLRDMLTAIRGYTDVKADLEAVKRRLEVVTDEKMRLEDRCEELNSAGLSQQYDVQFLQARNEALASALCEFCPRLDSVADLKRCYDAVSPALDDEGFKLYRAAEKLTGIDVSREYSYEDNCGWFEDADGHKLLGYLTALQFDAVEWEIVPGTCYERAVRQDVDKSTPEYKAFEKQLYTETLKTLGFEKLLPSEQRAGKEQKIERRAAHER